MITDSQGRVLVDADLPSPLPVTGTFTIDPTGLATDSNQTDGSQKTQIVDAGGEQVTVTGGKLDVNASIDTTGLATSALQTTANTSLSSIDTKLTSPITVTGTVSTGITQPLTDTQLRAADVKITLDGEVVPVTGTFWQATQPISASSLPLPTGAATGTKQDSQTALLTTIDGDTSNLDVLLSTRLKAADTLTGVTTVGTITNVVHVDDNGGSLTVDGTVAFSNTTIAVTNTGTFSVQATLQAGTAIVGKVGIDQTTPGTTNKVSLGSDVVHTIVDSATLGTVSISGTVTANAGSNLNTSALALAATQTDKSQFTKITDGTDTALITAAGELNVLPTAQPGVDIGDVTINNASGASAVNIQDGGNSITVDGTITANAGTNLNTSLLALETGGNLAAIAASASVLDDWDETDRAKVNLIVGQAGVSAGDGNVDSATQRVIIAANVLSTTNSSTVPLAIFGTFTGTSEDIMSYNEARISVYSDVPSTIDGLSIQQSPDNTNWVITDTYSIVALTGKTFSVPRQARYFRVVYTNGYIAQGTFILQTSYSRISAKSSSQRASDNYTNETDLEQQQAFLMNYNPLTGTWFRTRGDSTNGLVVNPQGPNIDYTKRLQEQQVLYAYSALLEEVGATERYNSSRDFIEIR